MASYHDQQDSPYTPEQLFNLVADVESYPEFLPWCRAARILERGDTHFTAELVIHFKTVTEQYTSRVELKKPDAIHVEMIKGPFHHLINDWKFSATDTGALIDFTLDFQFKAKWLDALIGALFTKATHKMVTAFSERADALYG